MKVIGKSNFDNEMVNDILIKDDLANDVADNIAKDMNDKSHENSMYFYKAVADDYVLYEFEP